MKKNKLEELSKMSDKELKEFTKDAYEIIRIREHQKKIEAEKSSKELLKPIIKDVKKIRDTITKGGSKTIKVNLPIEIRVSSTGNAFLQDILDGYLNDSVQYDVTVRPPKNKKVLSNRTLNWIGDAIQDALYDEQDHGDVVIGNSDGVRKLTRKVSDALNKIQSETSLSRYDLIDRIEKETE